MVKAESCQSMGEGFKRYIYFDEELHVGYSEHTHHADLLLSSRRKYDEIQVAGFIDLSADHIYLDGSGSSGLGIKKRDATPVGEHIKKFPDLNGKPVHVNNS